jgi:shikimate kinase
LEHRHSGRYLLEREHILHFIQSSAKLRIKSSEKSEMIKRIMETEILTDKILRDPTLVSDKFRDQDYAEDHQREKLRETILSECLSLTTLEHESQYCLGCGGLLPRSTVKAKNMAYILIGLPASGKSTLAKKLAEKSNSVFLDSDIVKYKFPEMSEKYGADVLHKEAGFLTFGGSEAEQYNIHYNAQEFCIANNYNIMVQKVGAEFNKIREYRDLLIGHGYSVHLILTHVDREVAVQRAFDRFKVTGRYVPLSLIYDEYANNPILTYYRVRNDKEWTSCAMIDNNINNNFDHKVVDNVNNSPIMDLEGVKDDTFTNEKKS